MEEIKKTGELVLLDALANVEKWRDLYMCAIEKIEGNAVLLVEGSSGYQVDIELIQAIPPQERILRFYDKEAIDNQEINEEDELTNIVFNGFLEMANELFLNMWGFIGNIINETGTVASIVIMFLEDYNICKYAIVTKSDVEKVCKEKYWHRN